MGHEKAVSIWWCPLEGEFLLVTIILSLIDNNLIFIVEV